MGTITYRNTIINSDWFDASPVMGNFNQVKDELNGELDEGNFSASMSPTMASLAVSEEITVALIQPSGSLIVQPPEGQDVDIRLESTPTTHYLRVTSTEVTMGFA